MGYVMSIFVADASSLKNRGFMFAFTSSPYIITVWVGGPLATAFLNGPGLAMGLWRLCCQYAGRRCAALRYVPVQLQEGRETRSYARSQ